MFAKIKQYIARRKLEKKRLRFQEGFEWAMSEINSGRLTPFEVSEYTQNLHRDEFDHGADFALMRPKDSSQIH